MIDEQAERARLVEWLGGDWVPSPQQVWLAARQQPVRVTREALEREILKAATKGGPATSHYDDFCNALRALNIEVIDA